MNQAGTDSRTQLESLKGGSGLLAREASQRWDFKLAVVRLPEEKKVEKRTQR